MKFAILSTVLLFPEVIFGQSPSPSTSKTTAVTEEELASRLRQTELRDLQKRDKAMDQEDPSKGSRPKDLLERSTILCFGGMATLVPKGALLHVPASLADRVGMQDGAKLISWPEFQAANRGWIVTQAVTMAQAEGKEALPAGVMSRLSKEINMVVSTFQGGPVSMLKPLEKLNEKKSP